MHRPLLLFIVAGLACVDDPGNGDSSDMEVCEPDLDYAFEPGKLWGPCHDDDSCDDSWARCVANTCGPIDCVVDHPWCAETIDLSPTTNELACLQACAEDEDCVPGQACDVGACRWTD